MARLAKYRRINRDSRPFAEGCTSMIQIDINSTDFTSDFVGYPLLATGFSLGTPGESLLSSEASNGCLPNGDDLRVYTDPYDSGTRLGIEIIRLETSDSVGLQACELWLEAGTVDATNGQTLYLGWGNGSNTQPARGATFGSEDVWNQIGGPDWRLVNNGYSFNGLPDSTPNHNDLTRGSESFYPITNVRTSPIYLGGSHSNYPVVGTAASMNAVYDSSIQMASTFTAVIWIRKSVLPDGYERIISRKGIYNQQYGWEVACVTGSSNQIDMNAAYGSHYRVTLPVGANLADNQWHQLVAVFNVGNAYLIYDGIQSTIATNMTPIQDDGISGLTIGQNLPHTEANFVGDIGPVMLADSVVGKNNMYSMYRAKIDPANHTIVTLLN